MKLKIENDRIKELEGAKQSIQKQIDAAAGETNRIELTGLKIGSKTFDLSIICDPDGERFIMTFTDEGRKTFSLQHFEDKLRIRRDVRRPNHDHDDSEYLLQNKKTGNIWWSNGYPYDRSRVDFANIPFGPQTVDY